MSCTAANAPHQDCSQRRSKSPSLRTIGAVSLSGLLSLSLFACKDSSEIGSVHVKSELITAANGGQIDVASADHAMLAGTSIRIAAGALSQDETITIGIVNNALIDDGATVAGPAVDFGPDGTTFSAPALVTIPYTEAFDEDLVRVYVKEGNGTTEILLPDDVVYNAEAKTITFSVEHFTSFQGGRARDACQHVVCPTNSADVAPNTCHRGRCGPRPCRASNCGPRPELPQYTCDDGTIAGPVCRRNDNGACGWEIDRCEPTLTCANIDCAEGYHCVETSAQGPQCVPNCDPANDRNCPCPQGDPRCNVCTPDQCGPAPEVPTRVCDDGSTAGPVCRVRDDGSCGWEVTDCPPVVSCANVLCAPGYHCVETRDGPTCVPQCADENGQACRCDPVDCGPAPEVPTVVCDDGSTAGPVCRPNDRGDCAWEITTCEPGLSCANVLCAPGHTCVEGIAGPVCIPDCDANGTPTDPNGMACPECPDSACGVRPQIPDRQCDDGTVAGTSCRPTANGTCGWVIVECPGLSCANVLCAPGFHCVEDDFTGTPECIPNCNDPMGNCPPQPCSEMECGPAPGAPSQQCQDGSVAGPVCRRNDAGACGWEITTCPNPGLTCANVLCAPGNHCVETNSGPTCVPDCSAAGSADPACPCSERECGPAPGAPSQQCADGTVAGPVCRRDANAACGWEITTCPGISCANISCPATTTCVETPMGPTCDPINCQPGDANCAPSCTDASCGARPGAPNYQCQDGTVAGPVCELDPNGTCTWNVRNCP